MRHSGPTALSGWDRERRGPAVTEAQHAHAQMEHWPPLLRVSAGGRVRQPQNAPITPPRASSRRIRSGHLLRSWSVRSRCWRCAMAARPGLEAPDRNLALELVRVTEAAAMAAGRKMGYGDKEAVDQAAVDAMRAVLGSISMTGVVVIGEGEKDNAPMLYNGEEIGNGNDPQVDIAVDPVDGTTLTAKAMPNGISVVALSEHDTMFDPGPCVYMEKLVVGREAANVVHFGAPLADNLAAVAKAKGAEVRDLTVCILDRPRHEDLVRQIREAGARIKFITDGDVAGAIMAARPGTGVDLLVGVGGTPEGVIAACALKCLDGVMFGRLWPRDDAERQSALDAGYDLDQVLTIDDLVRGDNVFFAATGVTDGELVRGVRFDGRGATTQSLSMRSKSGTVRLIEARHQFSKLSRYSSIDFG